MNTIRREKPGYGIVWSEIRYDGKNAGQFCVRILPDALAKSNPIATFAHTEKFRIAVGVHPKEGQVILFVGGVMPTDEIRHVYKLPCKATIPDAVAAHDLEAAIADGKVHQVTWNGEPLERL